MRKKNKLMLFVDLIVAIVLLTVDQFTKHLAIVHLKNQPAFILIDGILELKYLENRGSAFGILQNQKIFLLIVGFAGLSVILFILFKMPADKKFRAAHIALTAIIAGGIGNMADRFRYDYVVDFIYFVLIDFPIFNVADCYIVVFSILLFFLFIFVYKENDLEFLDFRQKHYREKK